jgi:ribonuclease E
MGRKVLFDYNLLKKSTMENQNQDYGHNGRIDVEEMEQQIQPAVHDETPEATPDTFTEEDLNSDTDDIGTADVDGLLEEVDDREDVDAEDDGTEEFDDLPTGPGNGEEDDDEEDDDLDLDDDDLGLDDDDSLPVEPDGDGEDLDDDINLDDDIDLDDDEDDDTFLK